jgi:hypothetical protein
MRNTYSVLLPDRELLLIHVGHKYSCGTETCSFRYSSFVLDTSLRILLDVITLDPDELLKPDPTQGHALA